MNIFVTDIDPAIAARCLDIKRQNKMLIESTQMLSTALEYYDVEGPYRPTHANHPCSIWTRTSYANFSWLYTYACHLGEAYRKRTGKIHKTHQVLMDFPFMFKANNTLPHGPLTPFVNCTDNYKHIGQITTAYILQLQEKWDNDKIKPRFDDESVAALHDKFGIDFLVATEKGKQVNVLFEHAQITI